MEIVRPFAPVVGGDKVSEEHEKLSSSFVDTTKSKDDPSTKISTDLRILEKYPILKKILLNKFYEFIKTSNLEYNNRFEKWEPIKKTLQRIHHVNDLEIL